MKMTQNRWKMTALLCVAIFAAGVTGCDKNEEKVDLPTKSAKADAPKAEASKKSTAATQKPTLENDTTSRRFTGSFEPQRTTKVAASVPGIIREVYVVEGQRVEKGDKLINIDAQNYRLQVNQAAAARDAAQAQVDTLQVEFERATKLREDEAIAASQLDQLTGQLAGARAQLAQAKVGVSMARTALGDALIRAPYDGVITMVDAAAGDFAAPSPAPLLMLAEVQKLNLRVSIPEQYSSQVSVGDTLYVRVDALDESMELPVTRINPMIAPHSRAFDVLAELDNSDLKVRSGMFAKVTLSKNELARGDEAAAVPAAKAADAPNAQADTQTADSDEGEK
ncbi:efflux RND transporter periplasmic adaptor subunit [Bradymonas sediminis]|uniref:Uncharacterized protein n=1 Tax=Bradymonas sediminis TaxID=1548548 RepID=A0A2Z4FMR5_9DELT|nr:efflux RND transporter periplasmic adaptor subunit [Bradymonas sediminis]AWV90271.1 hypothetical protein DN745_13395 [Bradymonas sediminis]TDP75761.1 RND family efflux transporter MFP subunit [Bradymonas sediminis]